jgi:hypothetical protein
MHVGSLHSLGNKDGNAQERINCRGQVYPVAVTKSSIISPLNGIE